MNRVIVITLCYILLLLGLASPCRADFTVTKVGDSVVDPTAVTAKRVHPYYGGICLNVVHCQQDAVVTHGKHQYVGYYDAERRLCLARRKLPAGDWSIVRFTDHVFRSNDDHCIISIGLCPKDGTLHMAWGAHNGALTYRVSRKGAATHPESVKWEASLFGPILSELEKGKPPACITYPRFWQTPDGNLQFGYRTGFAGKGDRWLVDYDGDTGVWMNTRQIDSGLQGTYEDALAKTTWRCSYPNGYDYGPLGRLHVTWTWRERKPDDTANHDIMYAYSEDRGNTWCNNQGVLLAGPPNVESPGIKVVDIGRNHSLINTQSQAVDSRGRIHTVMWHTTDETIKAAKMKPEHVLECWGPPDARRYHHYWRDDDGTWRHTELPWQSGTVPKLFMDKDDNAYLVYGATNRYMIKVHDEDHNCTIAAASAKSKWTDWKVIHVDKGNYISDVLGDLYRWKQEGVLSVMVQEIPKEDGAPAALKILDFSFGKE
jgi:hypothetical protein